MPVFICEYFDGTLQVQHPAAKMLVLATQQMEQEIGDGTNFVMVFAGALLEYAEDLLRMVRMGSRCYVMWVGREIFGRFGYGMKDKVEMVGGKCICVCFGSVRLCPWGLF